MYILGSILLSACGPDDTSRKDREENSGSETDTDAMADTDSDSQDTDPDTDADVMDPDDPCTGPANLVPLGVEFQGHTAEADMESFCEDGWTGVDGDLDVSAVLTVSPLANCLCEVTGDVYIGSGPYASFDGFRFLRRVDGDLTIDVAEQTMPTISGFDELESVGGNLRIIVSFMNEVTTDISGFPKLVIVGGNFDIARSIQGNKNPVLRDVSGFSALETVGGVQFALPWPILEDVTGFPSLVDIPAFGIASSKTVVQVSGFGGPLHIRGGISVTDNRYLNNLDGLFNVQSVGGDFKFERNKRLKTSHIFDLVDAIKPKNIDGDVIVSDNK